MSIFCIDIGGTETKYAVIEKDSMSGKGKCTTPNTNTEQFLSFLEKLWNTYGGGCKGIAISMPGMIDSEKGYVKNAGGVLRQIRETPFSRQLERITDVPVSVENDARCAALAELSAGALKGCKTAADEVNGYVIFELAESGSKEMLAVIKEYATQIARFIYNLQCIYDPEKIVIGGGISARTLLVETIQKEVNSIYEHDIFGLPNAVVVGSRFHNDANLIGAYYRFTELYK